MCHGTAGGARAHPTPPANPRVCVGADRGGGGRTPVAARSARRQARRPRGRRGAWHPATHLALLHAAPGLTVVAVGLGFGVAAARGHPHPGRLALLGATLLANQYAAGALNDAVDAPADAAAGRADKPVPAGAISRRATATLALGAGAASLGFAAMLGWAPLGLAVAVRP